MILDDVTLATVGVNVSDTLMSIDATAGDPYTHVVLGAPPLPKDFVYPLWRYWATLCIFGPILFNIYASIISLYTFEWGEMASFRRETWISTKGMVLTSPVLAVAFKAMFEQRVGAMYFAADDTEGWPWWYTYLVAPWGFWVVSDATFYFTHRLWHHPTLYDASHHHHHSCRPTTSFSGNAADVFELVLTGYAAALMPALIVPLDGQVYMFLTVISHIWTIYVHNYSAHCLPGSWFYDCHDHNIHHYYGQRNFNFGLYFKFWDRALGTYRATVPTSKRLQRKSDRLWRGALHEHIGRDGTGKAGKAE